MILKKKQSYALDILKKGFNVFLSGEAGTGKSFVIDQFTAYLDKIGKKYVVSAPTGLAALNVGGATLHRTFKLSIDIGDPQIDLKNVEEAEVIIIDEISMCRRDIFQYIAHALLEFENPIEEFDIKRESKICRKKQIVVVGDFFQLPPVLGKADRARIIKALEHDEKCGTDTYKHITSLKDTLYAFQCKEWEMLNFKSIVLDEVVRQSDKDYIDNLNKIRVGDLSGLDFIRNESSKKIIKNAIYITGTNETADNLNKKNLEKINDREYVYFAEEEGEVNESDKPISSIVKYKVGARVMSIVNIVEKKDKKDDREEKVLVVNGMLGTVIGLNRETVTVEFDNGYTHTFEKYKWSVKGFKDVEVKEKDKNGKETKRKKMVMTEIGSYSQIPLKLSWAITIHKSQGQSYECVNLDPYSFADGQLYVALSRAKNIKKLYLTKPLKEEYLKTSKVVKEFYASIQQGEYTGSTSEVEEVVKQEKCTGSTSGVQETGSTTGVQEQELDVLKDFALTVEKSFDEVTTTLEKDENGTVSMDIPAHLVWKVESLLKNEIELKEFESNEAELNDLRNTVKTLNEKISKLKSELEQTKLSAKRRPKISPDKEDQNTKLRKMGLGMNKIAKMVGCGDGTVRRVLIDNNIE